MRLLETAPALSSHDAEIVLRSQYYSIFGLNTPEMEMEPIGLVMMRDGEDVTGRSLLQERIRMFMREKVKDHSGLNLLEFLSLPRDVLLMVLEEASDINQKDHQATQAALAPLQQDLKNQRP